MSILLVPIGFLVAIGGDPVVRWFTRRVRAVSNLPPKGDYPQVASWIIGIFERVLAFGLVVANVEGTGTILIAWIAAKLAANWRRRDAGGETDDDALVRANTFIALMAGVLSVGIGVVGGVIARCGL